MPTQFFLLLRDWFRTRLVLQAEILALRQQLLVLQRAGRDHRLSLRWADRVLWVWLSQLWNDWPTALLIVKPRRSSPCIAKGFDSVGSGRVVAAMVDQPYIQKFGIYWAKEPGQPPLGCSSYSRRIAEDRNRSFSSDRRHIPGTVPQSSLANLADLSQEPCQGLGLGRLLHRPDGCIQVVVRLRHSRSWSPASNSLRRHPSSDY